MGSNHNNKKYNEDFKRTIVDLYNTGSSVKDLSNEYGVSEVTIYAWIKRFSPIKTTEGETITQNDIMKIKKQMLHLQEENEILKKAMAIFAKK